jgi:hypothetical protein
MAVSDISKTPIDLRLKFSRTIHLRSQSRRCLLSSQFVLDILTIIHKD